MRHTPSWRSIFSYNELQFDGRTEALVFRTERSFPWRTVFGSPEMLRQNTRQGGSQARRKGSLSAGHCLQDRYLSEKGDLPEIAGGCPVQNTIPAGVLMRIPNLLHGQPFHGQAIRLKNARRHRTSDSVDSAWGLTDQIFQASQYERMV